MRHPSTVCRALRRGFTAIDILTVGGIIGILTAVTIVAINPKLQLTLSYDAARKDNAKAIENCFLQHFTETRSHYAEDALNVGIDAKTKICAYGQSDDHCVSVDACMQSVARDKSETCAKWSGYSMYLDQNNTVRIVSEYVNGGTEDTSLCGVPTNYGMELRETGDGTSVAEGGATDTYLVRLTKAPSANVQLTPIVDAQLDTNPQTLTFTALNWSKFQTVTVKAVDDADTETTMQRTITHSMTSSDTNYDNLSNLPTVTATILDNDSPGFSVAETAGSTSVAENPSAPDHQDTYTIVLNTRPSVNVTVSINTAVADLTASPTSLVFTPLNWSTPQTVTLTAVNDAVIEGLETMTVTHTVTTTDNVYKNLTIPALSVPITDDDFAGIVLTPMSGSVSEATAGTAKTYTITLGGQPTANVTVRATAVVTSGAIPSSQVTVNTAAFANLTFTTANWNVPQMVSVYAINDLVREGDQTYANIIAHTTTSTDTRFNNMPNLPGTSVQILDNDVAGVTVTPTTLALVTEKNGVGNSKEYTVVLTSQPQAPVTITVDDGGSADISVSPTTLTFNPTGSNLWSTPQTVTVTGEQDTDPEGIQTIILSHTLSSADLYYAPGAFSVSTVTVTVDDDDPGFVLTKSAVTTPENGTPVDSFGIFLSTNPGGSVVARCRTTAQVQLANSASGPWTNPGTYLVQTTSFTSANYSTPKPVYVRAINDAIDEPEPQTVDITCDRNSGVATYNNAPVVTATIVDDDTAGVIISKTSISVSEANTVTDSYTVTLTSQPTGTVRILITNDTAQVTRTSPGNAYVTFTSNATDWQSPKAVYFRAFNDSVDEDDTHSSTITHAIDTVNTLDPIYAALTGIAGVTATITDNDTADLAINPLMGNRNEGQSPMGYTLRLATQPTAPVTVTITTDAQVTQTLPTSDTITFYPPGLGDPQWNVSQTIYIQAINDSVVEANPHPGITTNTVTSTTDTKYSGVSRTFTMNIGDNDTAGLCFSVPTNPAACSTTITVNAPEGGATPTYNVRLSAQPAGSNQVVVNISPDSQETTNRSSLVFNASNWNVNQAVVVTAVNDTTPEVSPHTGSISHAINTSQTTEPFYLSMAPRTVNVNITDNDMGIVVLDEPVNTDESDAGGTSFRVRLSQNPGSSTVNVTFTNSDGELTINPPSVPLTFHSGNWNANQTIDVTAIDDQETEVSPHSGNVTITTASASGPWNNIVRNVPVSIMDNDTPGVDLYGTNLDVDEDGGTDSYVAMLQSKPAANVFIAINVDGQLTRTPASLKFCPTTTCPGGTIWSAGQTVTIGAVNDTVAEGDHTGTITHVVTSSDPAYNALIPPVPDLTVDVTDNDQGIVVTEIPAAATEGGATGTFKVRLSERPVAFNPVTVTLTNSDGQVQISPTQLTFGYFSWNNDQVVTVTAVNDAYAEGTHSGTVNLSASAGAGGWNGITATATVTITDNETAGIALSKTGVAVSEDGVFDSYNVKLLTPPRASVTLTVSPDSQVTRSPATRTFSTANWNTYQSIVVGAVDDLVVEGSHTGIVSHALTSTDASYTIASGLPTVTATITDNDAPVVLVSSTNRETYEDGRATPLKSYTVRLGAQPTTNVVVTPVVDASKVTTSPASVTFTTSNWSTPQTITINAVTDTVYNGLQNTTITHTVTSTDPAYSGIAAPSVAVLIHDDDPEIMVTLNTYPGSAQDETGFVDFGRVMVASLSPPQRTFTVQNIGEGTLNLGTITVPAGFVLVNSFWDATLTAGQSTSFTVRLESSAIADVGGSLSFGTNDLDENPYNFNVYGSITATAEAEVVVQDMTTGNTVPITSGPIDYGHSPVGTPISRTFRIFNIGDATLTTNSLVVPTGFSIVDFLVGSILKGSYDSIIVRWNASTAESGLGRVQFNNNDADENPFQFSIKASSQ